MGLKEPYKANPRLVEQRDAMYGEPIEQIVERRKSIQPHTPHPSIQNEYTKAVRVVFNLCFFLRFKHLDAWNLSHCETDLQVGGEVNSFISQKMHCLLLDLFSLGIIQ